MPILDSVIETGVQAPRITLYGRPGVGKSTLANSFPQPFFLFTENAGLVGLRGIVIEDFSHCWTVMKELLALEKIPFQTLVIDSLTKLDSMLVHYILSQEKDPKKATIGSACGGYGKGYERAEELHMAFKAMADKWQARGVTVVYIAHTALIKDKMPETDDYEIHSIEMHHSRSRKVYINDVDAVLFCRQKSFIETTDAGKAIVRSTQNRVIVTGLNDAHVAKNRYAMPNEIPMSFQDLVQHIPFYNQSKEK